VIAWNFGSTAEEVDFIVNWEIMYGVGQDAEGGADE
jgi:hypothetical protein